METGVGSALEGGGGAGGFPAEAIASARAALRAQARKAQGPRPDSRAGKGEVSGATHRQEKLPGNSGWPPGAGDAEAVAARSPALSRLPSGPWPPSPRLPQLGLSWRGSREPARSEGTRPTSLPSGQSQPEPSPRRPPFPGALTPAPPRASPRRALAAARGVSMGPSSGGEAGGAFIRSGQVAFGTVTRKPGRGGGSRPGR